VNLIPDKLTIGYASAINVNATGLHQEAKIDNPSNGETIGFEVNSVVLRAVLDGLV